MPKLRLRPTFTALFLIGLGILLAPFVSLQIAGLYTLAVLCLCLAVALRSRPTLATVFLYAPLFVVGIARAEESMLPGPQDIWRWQEKPGIWCQGIVDSDVQRGSRGQVRFTLAALAVWENDRTYPSTGSAAVSISHPPERIPAIGDVIWLRGRLEAPSPATNPGGFDYREYLRRRGIFSLLRPKSPEDVRIVLAPAQLPWYRRWSATLRASILSATTRYLSPDDATLMNGLLLSAHLSTQTRMPVALTEAFATTGAVHILSVSGFHLTLIAAFLTFALRLLTAPRPAKNLLCIALLWLFVLASGGSNPAIRSAIMATLILAAPLMRRHAEPLHSLAAAAVGILLAQPGALYDPGFQLSFAVTATLLLWLPPLLRLPAFRYEPGMEWQQRTLWMIMVALLTGCIAALGTIPLTAYYFNRISLISPIAGVPLSVVSEVLLIAGLGASLLSMLPPLLIAPIWWIISLGIGLLRGIVFAFAALPGAAIVTVSPPVVALVLYYLLLGGMALIVRRKIRQKILFASAPATNAPAAPAGVPSPS